MQNEALNQAIKNEVSPTESLSFNISSMILNIPATSLSHNDLSEFVALCKKYLGKGYSNLTLHEDSEDPKDPDSLMIYYWIGNTRNSVMLGKQDIGSVVEFTDLKNNPILDWDAFCEMFFYVLKARIFSLTLSVDVNDNSHSSKVIENFYLDNFLNNASSELVRYRNESAAGTLFYQYEIHSFGDKVLTVMEKGKMLDLPDTFWIEWKFHFNSTKANIPWVALLNPQKYLAHSYRSLEWLPDAEPKILPTDVNDILAA